MIEKELKEELVREIGFEELEVREINVVEDVFRRVTRETQDEVLQIRGDREALVKCLGWDLMMKRDSHVRHHRRGLETGSGVVDEIVDVW